jgi:hypothetical protein
MEILSGRAYATRLAMWLVLYAGLLFGSLTLIDRNLVAWLPLRVALGLSPMIAGFGILFLVMGRYRSADELQQKIMAESLMFAFGATAIITFSYGFLQRTAGAPELSYFWVWPVMGSAWLLGSVIAQRRYE